MQRVHWPLIAGLGVAGALGQYAITLAFKWGEASLIAPLEYTALVWGVGLDLALWGVLPDSDHVDRRGHHRRERPVPAAARSGARGIRAPVKKNGPEGPFPCHCVQRCA